MTSYVLYHIHQNDSSRLRLCIQIHCEHNEMQAKWSVPLLISISCVRQFPAFDIDFYHISLHVMALNYKIFLVKCQLYHKLPLTADHGLPSPPPRSKID